MQQYYAFFSGGVDSTIAILKIARRREKAKIFPLFFDYGQKASEQEKLTVERLVPLLREFANEEVTIEDPTIISLAGSDLFSWSSSSILTGRPNGNSPDLPNRNMVLISVAVSWINSNRPTRRVRKRAQLVVGFKNEHYDTTRSFAVYLNKAMKSMEFGIEINTPLISNDNKIRGRALAEEVYKINGWERLMRETWSCYFPTENGNQCGLCNPCKHRRRFLEETATRVRKKLDSSFRL